MKQTILKKIPYKNHFVPVVSERCGNGERYSDVYSRLLKDRIIFITGAIDDEMANLVIAQLLVLESDDCESDIFLYIDSPGGLITAGLAIYDTMQLIRPDVSTLCIGQACSMGAFLLCAGAGGKRFSLPNSRILIHQPVGGFEGQVTDIAIQTDELIKIRNKLNKLMAYHTYQDEETIERDTERDTILNPYEAIEYGLIDSILKSRKRSPVLRY